MSTDPFDEILELEDGFYKEGFEAGVTDSEYAGLIEGKVFGIEKGYEKALEIGKARGRALVWQRRLDQDFGGKTENMSSTNGQDSTQSLISGTGLSGVVSTLAPIASNARLKKHIDFLLSVTDSDSIAKDNSDDSVGEMDERITKVGTRMKMISKMVGESVNSGTATATSIEDSIGLSARQ
jgi:hypothetical protein